MVNCDFAGYLLQACSQQRIACRLQPEADSLQPEADSLFNHHYKCQIRGNIASITNRHTKVSTPPIFKKSAILYLPGP